MDDRRATNHASQDYTDYTAGGPLLDQSMIDVHAPQDYTDFTAAPQDYTDYTAACPLPIDDRCANHTAGCPLLDQLEQDRRSRIGVLGSQAPQSQPGY